MLAYKVGLTSIAASFPLEVTYEVGKWATAPVNGLFCFDKYDDAHMFTCQFGWKTEIWLAKVEEKTALPSLKGWPRGTVGFRKVMLLKRVDRQGEETQ